MAFIDTSTAGGLRSIDEVPGIGKRRQRAAGNSVSADPREKQPILDVRRKKCLFFRDM
jgi:hypothetical protein